jgi:hypothetical protein
MSIIFIMRKLFTLLVLIALGAGLYMSKPQDPKKSFEHYLRNHEGENEFVAKLTAETCDFQDRYFWVDAKQDGKVIYTNVFHNWFNRAELKKKADRDIKNFERKAEDAKDKITGQ